MKSLQLLLAFAAWLTTCSALAALTTPRSASNATIPIFSTTTVAQATNAHIGTPVTSLDVMGIGLSVEMFRQSQPWLEMQKHPNRSILPSDLSTYPTNATIKELATEKRSADALEWGASRFVEAWPIPSISVWAHCHDEEKVDASFGGKTTFDLFNNRANRLRMPAGMHHHAIASLGAVLLDEPEDILERAFQFFEQNPEVPAMLLLASDGDIIRAWTGDMSREAYWEEGPRRIGSMTEAMVVLVLARRDRVDALRPFAARATAEQYALTHTERERKLNAARIARETGQPQQAAGVFKPSRYLPTPWNEEQISQFDQLATIAVVHRPVRVSYRKDKQGKPTFDPAQKEKPMRDKEQQAAFQSGLDTALQDIPGGKPARVFYDTGGPTFGRHVVPLSLAAHHSLPDFELSKPDQGYDLHARVGNTGAASPFVLWALAAIAAHHQKNASLTVNLRRNDEATITAVTPSPDSSNPKKTNTLNFKLAP